MFEIQSNKICEFWDFTVLQVVVYFSAFFMWHHLPKMVVWRQSLADKNINTDYDSDHNHTKSQTSSGRLKISYMKVGYLLNKN